MQRIEGHVALICICAGLCTGIMVGNYILGPTVVALST